MRLGIIVDTILNVPPLTGVTNRLYQFARVLQRKGIKVKLFLCNRQCCSAKDVEQLREFQEIHFIPEAAFYDSDHLENIIKNNRVDILQVEDAGSLVRFRHLATRLGIPICLELHDLEHEILSDLGREQAKIVHFTAMFQAATEIADAIVCMTLNEKIAVLEQIGHHNHENAHVFLVPNGICLDEAPLRGPCLDAKAVTFVGNLHYWPNLNAVRNLEEAFRHAGKHKYSDITLLCIGMVPRDLRAEFSSWIFMGAVENLNAALAAATLAVAPLTEGSGMKVKILDYCAAGLPVVTTTLGASGYESLDSLIIEDEICKYPALIRRLLNSPDELKQLGQMSRDGIERYFSIDGLADRMIEVYSLTLASDRRSGKNLQGIRFLAPPLWLLEGRAPQLDHSSYYLVRYGEIINKQ